MSKPKFFLDENISRKLYNLLIKENFDVVSVQSIDLFGIENGALINEAHKKNRVLITFDKDFLNFINKTHSGILIIDIHPARDIYVLPIFKKFINNPKIYELNWFGKIIILKEDKYEIE